MIDVATFRGRKIFGKKLADARDAIYFSQEKFATKAGISRGTIARYEGLEVVSVSPGSMIKMAGALGLPLADLEKKIGAPPDSPTEEWTTVRLPRSLVADLRSAARKRKVNIEEFLAEVVTQAKAKEVRKGRKIRHEIIGGDEESSPLPAPEQTEELVHKRGGKVRGRSK